MTDQPAPAGSRAEEALEVLCQLMHDPEASSARVAAAKAVMGRPEPKNDEEHKREAEEREMSLAAARGILADLTAAKSAGVHEPPALDFQQTRPNQLTPPSKPRDWRVWLILAGRGWGKRFTTCANKFDNAINFGGFPYVPGVGNILQYPDTQ